MSGFKVAREATRAGAFAALLLAGCGGAPELPPGAISSESAQKLILERDDARDQAAARERELLARIERLEAEVSELRAAPLAVDVRDVAPDTPAPDSAAVPARETALAVEMQNFSALPIESNSSWTRFSWQGIVHNNLDRPITVNAIVLFLDSAGFELESIDNRLTLQPGEFRKISGVKMVDDQVAPRVSAIGGRVER